MHAHFHAKPAVAIQHLKFYTHSRYLGESVAAFVAEPKWLSEHGAFGESLKDTCMLRDRPICGMSNSCLQHCLLGESADLTFKKALGLAQVMEDAEQDSQSLQKPRLADLLAVKFTTSPPRPTTTSSFPCPHCGGKHWSLECCF